jgi:hypothetical protein
MRSRLPAISLSGAVLFACGVLTGIAAAPLWRSALRLAAQDRFGQLTYLCDHAMREHLIAKQELALRPGAQNVSSLKAAEVALVDCQDYDFLRKRLIGWGLTDNDLSLMGLKAIEAQGVNLQKVIEIHEIRY